tara:strand:+ start:6 stop:842 length:837 start_codon:yes stop_codon:yes gene_type:complete
MNSNIILIPCYIINDNYDMYEKYKSLVDINLDNIKKLKINCSIIILKKNVLNLRDMWVDILNEIINLTSNNNNVIYMEADTILFKNLDEIFNYDKVLCFGLGYWNMSFKYVNEFNKFEYFNSGLVYFPQKCNFKVVYDLYKNWPEEGDKKKLISLFPNFNFNFGNRILDYSGTYWEYLVNILFYSQFNNKRDGIEFISNNFGMWKYNYRGCLYKKYPIKNYLSDINNISHCHFLIYSKNQDKNIRFTNILKLFSDINNLIYDEDLLNDYIKNIEDNMF